MADVAAPTRTPPTLDAHFRLDVYVPMTTLNQRQNRVTQWLGHVIPGDIDIPTRQSRFLEESTELVQAGGMSRELAHRIVDYVYDREVGDVSQEIGGVMVTLCAAAGAMGYSVEAEFDRELERIHHPEVVAKVRKRQAEKRAAGL
jgi:hypothetical protein